MNLKELQSHIDSFDIQVDTLKADGSNAVDFFCADVVGNKRFAQNYGGYPRSEIAEINAAANLEQQKVLLSQLEDYSSSRSNVNAGLSDAEIMLGHKSKYLQTATEVQSYLAEQIQIRDAKRAEVIRQAELAKSNLANDSVGSDKDIVDKV